MSKVIREINIYPLDDDFAVSKIILNQNQFSILKENLNNNDDKNYSYVYPVTLKDCLHANIIIPSEYRKEGFEFHLVTYENS
ncbi:MULTISPECIES: hypothetical protein [unclassified Psychrobacter]|uniref:hypothetical protein n=1 Tax=unclassified Psychrobacter TaxID=196806 RepID=UPI00178864DC|nr:MULTISPECIES: hypothetical protein [unclassified Psychrobacter]MBE0442452.1 hypothetical protein [Psychrobacter sp. FME13]